MIDLLERPRHLSTPVRRAWEASFLAGLDAPAAASLQADARELLLQPGEPLFGGVKGSESTAPILVVDGLVRVAVTTPQGRELTVNHAAAGSVIGLSETLLDHGVDTGAIKAESLLASRVLRLSARRFRQVMIENACVATAVARYLARETNDSRQFMARGVFLPVKARVAQHLLDVASREGGALVARTTHQEIATPWAPSARW